MIRHAQMDMRPKWRADLRNLVLSAALLLLPASPALAQSDTPAYQDLSLSAEARAADLVSRMTLDEKAAQLINDAPAIPRLGVREYN